MAGRYYPGVNSENANRKAKKLRVLMAWAKSMEQKKTTGQEQAVKPKSGSTTNCFKRRSRQQRKLDGEFQKPTTT